MAEIEHFCDPNDKNHHKFKYIAHVEIPLLSAVSQENGNMEPQTLPIGLAVESKLVDNETLGYFIARSFQFLTSCGIRSDAIRFR